MKIVQYLIIIVLMFGLFNCKNKKPVVFEVIATVTEIDGQEVTFSVDDVLNSDDFYYLIAYDLVYKDEAGEFPLKKGEKYKFVLSNKKISDKKIKFPEIDKKYWLVGDFVKEDKAAPSTAFKISDYERWRRKAHSNHEIDNRAKVLIIDMLKFRLTEKDGSESLRYIRLICKTSEVIVGDSLPEYFTLYFNPEKDYQPAIAVPELTPGSYILNFAPYSGEESGMVRPIPEFNPQLIDQELRKEEEMIAKEGKMPEPTYETNGLRLIAIYPDK